MCFSYLLTLYDSFNVAFLICYNFFMEMKDKIMPLLIVQEKMMYY